MGCIPTSCGAGGRSRSSSSRSCSRGDSAARQQLAEQAALQEQLYAEIGRLTTQVSWLKKKAGVDHLPG